MAAQVSMRARFEARAHHAGVRAHHAGVRTHHAGIEEVVGSALASARPSLDEILSLWPVARHDRIVLWAWLGADGALSIGASLRDQASEGQPPAFAREVAREVRRIHDDVPVVLHLEEVGRVVVPMRALKARR